MQTFMELSAAVHELSCKQRKNLPMTLKTILSSQPWTVTSAWNNTLYYDTSLSLTRSSSLAQVLSKVVLAIGSCSIMHTVKRKKTMWPWPLNDDLEIQQGSRGRRGTCACKISPYKCSSSLVINSALDFGQLLDFDCEYLLNESSNWQAENVVIKYDFSHIQWELFCEFWSTNEKIILTFDLWRWNSIGFMPSSRYMFMKNIIKLSAAVHELSC